MIANNMGDTSNVTTPVDLHHCQLYFQLLTGGKQTSPRHPPPPWCPTPPSPSSWCSSTPPYCQLIWLITSENPSQQWKEEMKRQQCWKWKTVQVILTPRKGKLFLANLISLIMSFILCHLRWQSHIFVTKLISSYWPHFWYWPQTLWYCQLLTLIWMGCWKNVW